MTALDIITQARERLGDEKKQRWTDTRLLSIVSQGQVDICVESGYLRKEVILPFVVGGTRFTLPRDCYSIKRVEFNDKLLPLFSRSDKDVPRTSQAEYVAYKSNLQVDKIEIQPAITKLELEILYAKGDSLGDTLTVANPYGVVVSSTDPSMTIDPITGVAVSLDLSEEIHEVSDGYGMVTGSSLDISDTDLPNGPFGVVVGAEYLFSTEKYGSITAVDNHIVSGLYGIVTDVASIVDTFHVYYVATPDKLNFIETTLVMPERWEDILIRYTVGTALQDDNDANNIARGEAELQKYAVKLATIKKLSSEDFSSGSSDKFSTTFRSV